MSETKLTERQQKIPNLIEESPTITGNAKENLRVWGVKRAQNRRVNIRFE